MQERFMAAKKSHHVRGEGKSGGNGNSGASSHMQDRFSHFAQETARLSGRPAAFLIAATVIVVWAISGPIFGYSDTWQLVINTGTTIVTFLMVFLIQNTQNRDTLAIQLKLGELILAMENAPNRFATIEDLSDEDLEALHDDCRLRAETALEHLERRRSSQPKGKGHDADHARSGGEKR